MEEFSTRHRLRSYLIAAVLPLAGLPLVALAALTYFFVSRAVDQETSRRARPELAALARNFETAERKLAKQLAALAREDAFKVPLLTGDDAALGEYAGRWAAASQFESLRVFDPQGHLRADASTKPGPRALEAWSALFGTRRPASVAAERAPSSTRLATAQGRFERPGRLSEAFRVFLRSEDAWIAREAPAGQLRWVFYKTVLDASYRPLGYAEATLTLDDARLAALAEFQGLDLVLIAPDLRVLAASMPEAARRVGRSLLQNPAAGGDLRAVSREVKINEKPVEFFFGPLPADAPEPVAWVGAGLSKADQILFRNRILLWVGLLAAGMAVIVVWLTFAIARRITRPVTDLVRAVEAMRAGEWVQPVQEAPRNELGYLVRRFNDMALSVQVTKNTLETKLDELAAAHEQLTATQGQLVQSAKLSSLGQLVAGVAHELNNPIAFIYSNLSQLRQYLQNLARLDALLKQAAPALPPAERARLEQGLREVEWDYVRQDLEEITRSCLEGSVRVKDIVLGLRNFSRLDRGEMQEADLHAALDDTVKLLASQIKNRVEIHRELCADGLVRCNASQINQVLMNLLANAAQAVEGRGHIWIRTSIDAERDEFVVSLRDDGKGIAPEHLDRIFDPFFTTKKVGDGTGLGLSIVYGIVERHRGSIHVRSLPAPSPGHGTEFTLRLPRAGPAEGGTRQAS